MNIVRGSIVFIPLLALLGCAPEKEESPTRGRLHILAAESFGPSMALEVDEFMQRYRVNGADVTHALLPSEVAVSRFVLDTARMIFTTIPLTADERRLVEQTAGTLIELAVAYDGVAVIVHYKNPTDRMTVQDVRRLLDGSVTRWDQFSLSRPKSGPIRTYLQPSSDEAAYLLRRFPGMTLPGGSRATHTASSLETLHKVAADPQGIGFVAIDWIDSAKVPAKVLELAQSPADVDTAFPAPIESVGKFYEPHPAHIYRNYYPFKRSLIMYTRSPRGDIASGFGTFVANKEGQRIFLERQLVPGTQPIRLRPSR